MLAVLVAAIVLFASAYSIWQLNSPQKTSTPTLPSIIHGTVRGTVFDMFANKGVEGAEVRITDSTILPGEYISINSTDSFGTWECDDINFTEPLFIEIYKGGYYPIEFASVSAQLVSGDLYSCGRFAMARISTNFTLSITNGLFKPVYDGETITISRGDALSLIVTVTNYDTTASLGLSLYPVSNTAIKNTLGLWVYPMSNTVVFYNPDMGASGFENVTFGPLNAPPNYAKSYSGFQPDLGFSEAGNYTVFISYKDSLWGADATAYTSMTFYVNVLG